MEKPKDRGDVDPASAIARELAAQLSALVTPEPAGTGAPRPAAPAPVSYPTSRSGPAASAPLPLPPVVTLAGPRAILENGARFVSPSLPGDARFRGFKALVLRALRIVTRDQGVFNSALFEALRTTLVEVEAGLRDQARWASDTDSIVSDELRDLATRIEDGLAGARRDLAGELDRLSGEVRDELSAIRSAASSEAARTASATRSELNGVREAVGELRAAATEGNRSLGEALAAMEARLQAETREGEARLQRFEGELSRRLEAVQSRAEDAIAELERYLEEEVRASALATIEKIRVDLEERTRRLEERVAASEAAAEASAEERERDLKALLKRGLLDLERRLEERLDEGEERRRSKEEVLRKDSVGARAVVEKDLFQTQLRVDVLEARSDQVRERVSELTGRSVGSEERLGSLQRVAEEGLGTLRRELAQKGEELRGVKLEWTALRSELRRGALAAPPVPAGEPSGRPAAPLLAPAADTLSAGLYADFERTFRGAEEVIRERQARDVALFAGATGPIADLGCGRGEFLEALREAGRAAIGCDSSPVMVARAREKGLDVAQEDLFSFLERQHDASLGGITAYQVVEHLPSTSLAPLVELAVRKLAPGGRLLLETVNPESVFAMKWFWMDLTHVRPVPAPSLAKLMEATGMRDITIDYRSPVPESEAGGPTPEGPFPAAVAHLLFGPQDIAVTGVR